MRLYGSKQPQPRAFLWYTMMRIDLKRKQKHWMVELQQPHQRRRLNCAYKRLKRESWRLDCEPQRQRLLKEKKVTTNLMTEKMDLLRRLFQALMVCRRRMLGRRWMLLAPVVDGKLVPVAIGRRRHGLVTSPVAMVPMLR
jgi:hypothetical protein